MGAVHSAWQIDNIEELFAAGAEHDIAVTPAIVALSVVTAHNARGQSKKPQVVTITQTEAAHMIGVSERSIGLLFSKLADMGFLTKQRSGRFVLGPYWKMMASDHRIRFAGLQHDDEIEGDEEEPAKAPKATSDAPATWQLGPSSEGWSNSDTANLRIDLKPLAGFVSLTDDLILRTSTEKVPGAIAALLKKRDILAFPV